METRRQDKDMYHDFINYFVKPVVGLRKFDGNCFKFLLSRYVTVSDEAFALLTFENNYDCWLDMAKKNNWASSDIRPLYSTGGNGIQTPTKTQSNKQSKDTYSTNSMYRGWSIQGIRHFNVLYKLVEKERNTEAGFLFEEGFLQEMQEKMNKRNKKNYHNEEFVECKHNLWVQGDDINDAGTADAILESGHYRNSTIVFQNLEDMVEDKIPDNDDDNGQSDGNLSSTSSVGFKKVVSV